MPRICPNCGAAAADIASFCTTCGTRLPEFISDTESPVPPQAPVPQEAASSEEVPALEETVNTQAAQAEEATPAPEETPVPQAAPFVPQEAPFAPQEAPVYREVSAPPLPPETPITKKKKPVTGRVIAIVLALLVVAAGVLFYLYHEGIIGAYSLDVNQYVRMEPYGYNGYAEVSPSFRRSEFLNDAAALLKGRADARQNQAKELAEMVESYLDTEEHTGLSNGDVITLQWPEEFHAQKDALLKQYHLRLLLDDNEFTVSGLEDPKVIDIFEGLTFELNGNDGYGYFWDNMDFVNDYSWNFSYEYDKKDHLSNGDVVNVTAEFDGYGDYTMEDLVNSYGLLPESMTTSFTVEGLPEIVDVDPFDAVSFTADGLSGSATVRFRYDDSNEPEDFPYMSLDDSTFYDVSNGDELTVTFYRSEYTTDEELAEYYGVRITRWEKVYTIDSLDAYVSDFSMLTEERLTELREKANAAMETMELQPLREGGAEIVSTEHLGEYIILPVGDGPIKDCGLLVMYKNVIQLDGEDFSYITYIFFNKPVLKADGQLEYRDDLQLPNATYTISATNGDHVLHGVEDMDAFTKGYIEGNQESLQFISNFS